jgi:hypothetical protein
VPVQETFGMPWLLSSAQYKIFFFPYRTQFRFLSHHRPASWCNRQTGPPVSVSVSLVSALVSLLQTNANVRLSGAGGWGHDALVGGGGGL